MHPPRAPDQNGHDTCRVQPHELQVTHNDPLQLGGQDQPDLVGEPRQLPRGRCQQVVDFRAALIQRQIDGLSLRRAHSGLGDQPIDIEAVGLVRRNPARGGVRLNQQPLLFEMGHDASDRGR